MIHSYITHHNLAVISTVFSKKKAVARRTRKFLKGVQACDEKTIIRLNLLVKSFPFCACHRQKSNDPLQ